MNSFHQQAEKKKAEKGNHESIAARLLSQKTREDWNVAKSVRARIISNHRFCFHKEFRISSLVTQNIK